MTVKELVLLTGVDLEITVTDNYLTYYLDASNCSCPFDNYVVKCVDFENDKLHIICEQMYSNNLEVIEYVNELYYDDRVKVINGNQLEWEGHAVELKNNAPYDVIHSVIKNITHESGDNYENSINLYIR